VRGGLGRNSLAAAFVVQGVPKIKGRKNLGSGEKTKARRGLGEASSQNGQTKEGAERVMGITIRRGKEALFRDE